MEDLFFDRKDILEILDKRINGLKEGFRQNIAIIGDELLGKTSLIKNFLSNFRDQSILMIYIEMRPEPFTSFTKRFLSIFLYNLLKDSDFRLKENFDFLIERAIKFFPKTSLKIKEILTYLDKKRYLETFLNLLSLPKVVKAEANKFSLIVFDEFCNIEEFDIKRIYQEWAKIIILDKDTMYILISSEKTKAKNILSSELSLLFGNFEIIEIQPFNLNLSYEFIEKIISPFRFPRQISEYLINFTGGIPFYLNLICKEIKDLVNQEKNSDSVSQDLFLETLCLLLFDEVSILNQRFLGKLLPLNKEFLSILISVASGHNRIKDICCNLHLQKKDISLKLSKLREKDLIQKNGDFFKINDRVFNFWIKFVYIPKINSLIIDEKIMRDEFKRRTSDSISEFVDANRKGTLTQIMELFSSFSDDRILIEKKRLKLDRFREIKPLEFAGRKLKEGILGRSKENLWIAMLKEDLVTEADVSEFSLECAKYGKPGKIQKRLIIAFSDMDVNARLLSKELKIETWDTTVLNLLSDIYNKPRIVIFKS